MLSPRSTVRRATPSTTTFTMRWGSVRYLRQDPALAACCSPGRVARSRPEAISRGCPRSTPSRAGRPPPPRQATHLGPARHRHSDRVRDQRSRHRIGASIAAVRRDRDADSATIADPHVSVGIVAATAARRSGRWSSDRHGLSNTYLPATRSVRSRLNASGWSTRSCRPRS